MSNYLVTGAASGIGREVTLGLLRDGHQVVAMDTNAALLDQIGRDVGTAGFVAFTGSVTDEAACDAAADLVLQTFGSLDGLSHNAGIVRYGTAGDTTPDLWSEVIAVNLTGAFLVARAALVRMTAGSIVMMGSVSGLASQTGVVAYTASKHGLLGLTRSIAMDYAAKGIRCNMIAPGAVDTPMLRHTMSLADDPAALDKVLQAMHPMGRVARAAEVADLVLYLLSPRSSFVTGEVIRVDGGLLTQIAGSPAK